MLDRKTLIEYQKSENWQLALFSISVFIFKKVTFTCMPQADANEDVGWNKRQAIFAKVDGIILYGCRKRPGKQYHNRIS